MSDVSRPQKWCYYCGSGVSGTTRDHVIAKCLLEKPYPNNLFTVRSCEHCNSNYKRDEEYFLAVLAKTGHTRILREKNRPGATVDRMLLRPKSQRFNQRINDSLSASTASMQVDEKRLESVVQKIAFGLFIHRYKRMGCPPKIQEFKVWPIENVPSGSGHVFVLAHDSRFRPRRWTVIQKDVLRFMFVRNWFGRDAGRLVCVLDMYGHVLAAVTCPHWGLGRSSATGKSPAKPSGKRANLLAQTELFDVQTAPQGLKPS